MPIRSRKSLIMGQIEPEHPELFALEFGKKLLNMTLFTLYLLQILTNLSQNACDHKISDYFDHGSNWTRTA